MKILVVCQHYYPETFTITPICEEWVRRGHDVFVVTGKPNYGFGKILDGYENITDEVINGVRVHRCNLYPREDSRISIIKNYLSFWKNSKRYCRHLKEEFDVVYSMSLSPIISVSGANIYAKKHHVKHILHCLDLWPESVIITNAVRKNSLAYFILYRWSKMIYAKADKVLISSPSFETYFRDVLKLKNLLINYVPQPALLVPAKGEDIQYTSPFNLVYAGNIGTLQLVENLTLAVSLLKNEYDVKLHLIGMGAREEAVKRIIAEKGLQENVIFYGPKARAITATYFPNATAILVSLHNEGYVGKTIPNKLTSSLYYGRPILACIGGDGKEILEKAKGSIFSSGESPEQLAEAMKKLFDLSEEQRAVLGRNNKEYFNKNFSFEKAVERITDELK